jgi:hypothetical protein
MMTAVEMRAAIISGIQGLKLTNFAVSQELPWDAAGTPLYIKNPKTFYVAMPESTESALFNTLCGGQAPSLASRETAISAFVLVDAKNLPANYPELSDSVPSVKNTAGITGVRSREVDVNTTFEADSLLTEFVFRFTELKVN